MRSSSFRKDSWTRTPLLIVTLNRASNAKRLNLQSQNNRFGEQRLSWVFAFLGVGFKQIAQSNCTGLL